MKKIACGAIASFGLLFWQYAPRDKPLKPKHKQDWRFWRRWREPSYSPYE